MPYKDKNKQKESFIKWKKDNKEKMKDYSKKSYLKHRDEILEKQKEHYQQNKTKIIERQEKYKLSNPIAHNKQKIRRKSVHKIKLKPICEICNSTQNLERHHWNYDKPLLVNTLCSTCHDVQHVKNFQQSKFGGMILSH